MLLSCETVRISSPAFYKDPPLHESQFRSPADVEINSLASFDAARVKDLFVLLPWLLPLRLGCSARRLGSAARHSSKAAWRLGSPARHGGALRQLATVKRDNDEFVAAALCEKLAQQQQQPPPQQAPPQQVIEQMPHEHEHF